MNSKSTQIWATLRYLAVIPLIILGILSILASGGGGGGGGSGGGGPPAPTPPPAPTVALDAGNAEQVAGVVLSQILGSSSLGNALPSASAVGTATGVTHRTTLGQLTARLTQRLAGQAAQAVSPAQMPTQTFFCLISGSVTITLSADGTSADAIFNACEDFPGEIINGSMSLSGLTVGFDSDGRVNFISATATVNLTFSVAGNPDVVVTGSFTFTETTTFVAAFPSTMTTITGTNLVATSGGGTLQLFNFSFTDTFDSMSNLATSDGDFTMDCTVIGSVVAVLTPIAFQIDTATAFSPHSGQVEITGASGSRIVVTAIGNELAPVDNQVTLGIDADGDGSFETTINTTWTALDQRCTAFDDFSAAMIDRTKWANLEFVRQINNGVLQSAITRFGSNGTNNLNFVNTSSVNAFQADVTVTAVSNTQADPSARLVGAFYNDGTPGGGFTGEIVAGTEISHNGTELVGSFFVARCIEEDCNNPGQSSVILFDNTTFGPVALGETHTLSLAWDGVQFFTFGFNGATFNFDPTVVAPVAGPSQVSFKGIGTRISEIDAPGEGGFIAATFDNVMANGSLYDDFASGTIDRTKWANLEFVRQINNGVLQSAITRFGSNGNNSLNLIDPDAVSAIQADVTVTAVSNTNGRPRARVQGDFYNVGTPGDGFTGDVLAETSLAHDGTQLVVALQVFLCGDFDCSAGTTLFFDTTAFGPVAVGETHTLSVAWDGALFTFGFDGATTTFDPTAAAPVVGPPERSFKRIGTRVTAIAGPDEGAFIAATFDNVVVTP